MAALLAAAFLILLPAASAVPSVSEILIRGGQYNTLLHFLQTSYQENTLQSQLQSNGNGITIFAPTDSAFQKLPAGFADTFSGQELSEFVLSHVLPNFYSDFSNIQNPVYTMAGGNYTLNIRAVGGQVSLSTGVAEATASPLNVSFPLALYSIDSVLQPPQLFTSAGPSTTSPPATQSSPAPGSYSPQSPTGPTSPYPAFQAPASSSSYTPYLPAPASYSPYTPSSVAPASYPPYTPGYEAPASSYSTLPAPASSSSVTPAPGSSSPDAAGAPGSLSTPQGGGTAAVGANLGMIAGVGLVGFLAVGLAL